MAEIIAEDLNEINPLNFTLSDKQTRTWSTGSYDFIEPYNREQNLCFTLNNVFTTTGVRRSKYNKFFISIALPEELSDKIRGKIEDPMFDLIWANKERYFKKGSLKTKFKSKEAMRGSMDSMISTPDEVPEGKNYGDSLFLNIPTKTESQQAVVDKNLCVIEDLDGNNYNWMSLDKGRLAEVVIEIEMISLKGEKIRPRARCRMIVPEQKAPARIQTKRTLIQRAQQESQAAAEADTDTTSPATAPTPNQQQQQQQPAPKKLKTNDGKAKPAGKAGAALPQPQAV